MVPDRSARDWRQVYLLREREFVYRMERECRGGCGTFRDPQTMCANFYKKTKTRWRAITGETAQKMKYEAKVSKSQSEVAAKNCR